jgi:CBS domain containing-hemolysin-like protein
VISGLTVILVGVVCVVIEAFFSGSEIAMVSANRSRLRHRAAEGDRGARLVEELLAEPQTFLATTLLGTNLGAVSFSVTVALYLLGHQSDSPELLAFAMVTPITLILGEVVPKSLSQQFADQLAPRIAYPLRAASIVLRPAVWVMSNFAGVVTRVLRSDRKRAFVTREELALLIESEAGPRSEIKQHEREMISNLLELSDLEVGDVMVPLSEVTALPEDTTLAEAITEVGDKQHSRMPVYRSRVDDVVGILHVFDMLRSGSAPRSSPIGDLARPAMFVPPNQRAVDLLVALQGTGNQMAIVVDEYGGAIGVVTVEDILEEVVGDIEDEYDAGPSPIVQERPGVWRVEARTPVERLNQDLGLDLPEGDDYESVAGLILHRSKRIPDPGESLVVGGVTLRVLKASDRAIEEVQVLRRRKR